MKTPILDFPACSGARDVPREKVADLLGQSPGEPKYAFERNVFAERDKMHLVVTPNPFAVGTD